MLRVMMAAAVLCTAAIPAMAADPAAGEKAFAVCKACHKVGEGAKNGVGPALNGVVDRAAASVEHDPALSRRRRVRLVLGRAGRGLDAPHHEIE